MRSERKEILEEGGFTIVTKSRRNRRRGSKTTAAKKATHAILEDEPLEDCEEARDKIIRQVRICQQK